VAPADPAVVGAAGMTQPVWQLAAWELHDIMQFVTVEVTGLEPSPVKGGATLGTVDCASATSCAQRTTAAAAIRTAKTRMMPSVGLHTRRGHHSRELLLMSRVAPAAG
jgi:hypothetical protein